MTYSLIPRKFLSGIRALHFQFASYAYVFLCELHSGGKLKTFTTSVRL